jgi:membrane associated rhomboid family serine protease
MIPIGTDAPQRRKPLMNWAIIAACAVIYFISHQPPLTEYGLSFGWDKFMLNPESPHLYQFITYQFLHANLMHILGNMLFLWVFGNQMNDKLGHLPYLFFFLAGGVMAGCGQMYSSPAPTLGASGSIAAVAGLFLVLAPMTNIRVWFYFFIFDVPSVLFVLVQILLYDVTGAYLQTDNVAHLAHLSGYSLGFAVGIILLATGLVPRDHYDLLALINRWRRRREYSRLVNQGYNPFTSIPSSRPSMSPPGFPLRSAPAAAEPDPRIAALREQILQQRKEHRLADAAAAYVQLKQIDPSQVMPAEVQLDMGNQLMSEGKYQHAAQTYEDYLKFYPTSQDAQQVELILGLIYARYQSQPQRAIELLNKALTKLHDPGQRALAEQELRQLQRA